MPDYDEFAETYQRWSATASPYSVIETYSFLRVLGSVQGLRILDLAAGEGRISRMLMERGAASVIGADISPEMVRRATEQNVPDDAAKKGGDLTTWQNLNYIVLDAGDAAFQLDAPVDVVTAMYLLHYAPTVDDLERMTHLAARNLKPGGRLVTYTLSPDYDFGRVDPLMMERCGFDYAVVDGAHCELIIGGESVDIWQWSQAVHEECLRRAGFTDIRWHALQAPPKAPEVEDKMDFYLNDPSCIVLSAAIPLAH